MITNYGNLVIPDREAFLISAGTSRRNFFLLGLRYKISVRVSGAVSAVYLYSAGEFGDLSNRYQFTPINASLYEYEEVSGTGATAIGNAAPGSSFVAGAKFYFRIVVVGVRENITFDRIFWVRNPSAKVFIGTTRTPYISPYPVLIGDETFAISVLDNAKSESGEAMYGGIATVEFFGTPGTSSAGETMLAETAIADLVEITVANRDSSSSVAGFLPPPGAPDFSRYYHYITARVRAVAGSENYIDIPFILFAAAACAIEPGTYGYPSAPGHPILPPPVAPDAMSLTGAEPTEATEPCNSYTKLTTSTPVNQYAQTTTASFYSAPTGGTLLASGPAVVSGVSSFNVNRSDMGGDVSAPITGYVQVTETGPDRTSDRIETYIPQCASVVDPPGYTIVTVTGTGGTGTITTSGTGIPESSVTTVLLYDAPHGGVATEFSGTRVDANTIEFSYTEDKSGWWSVTVDGSEVIGERLYSEVTIEAVDLLYKYRPSGGGNNRHFWKNGMMWRAWAARTDAPFVGHQNDASIRTLKFWDSLSAGPEGYLSEYWEKTDGIFVTAAEQYDPDGATLYDSVMFPMLHGGTDTLLTPSVIPPSETEWEEHQSKYPQFIEVGGTIPSRLSSGQEGETATVEETIICNVHNTIESYDATKVYFTGRDLSFVDENKYTRVDDPYSFTSLLGVDVRSDILMIIDTNIERSLIPDVPATIKKYGTSGEEISTMAYFYTTNCGYVLGNERDGGKIWVSRVASDWKQWYWAPLTPPSSGWWRDWIPPIGATIRGNIILERKNGIWRWGYAYIAGSIEVV